MFSLRDVKYKQILDITSLSIPYLKNTFITGNSGSGKSTLLKLLNKLISPDSGHIYYKDTLLTEIPSVNLRRKVIMLGQSATVFKGNIRDNLLIGLKFSEKEFPNDRKLKSMLDLVCLNKPLDKDIYTLSGGEKQRLCLARVLLLNPEVLILDEPSSALDETTEFSVLDSIFNFTKNNDITPIVVTHSINVKEKFSENIIKLSNEKTIMERES